MPLRCLLFSSNEAMIQPIRQVLTDLGIEEEYCASAVDAVEKVTTQMFQMVITDWDDQPEAAFLLKTARDLKAANRPLTLAIVSDDARLPEALTAGANSVLVKPISAEQVRDTMSTACELIRAKQPAAKTTPASANPMPVPAAALAAGAAAGIASAPASSPVSTLQPVPPPAPLPVPAFIVQAPEKAFRAGEFLQSPNSAPGAQFDTEPEVQGSLEQESASEVDALTDLEPTAAAVQDSAAEPAPVQQPLTGWAALQARLTKPAAAPADGVAPKSELLSYGDTSSYGGSTYSEPSHGGLSHGESSVAVAAERTSSGMEAEAPAWKPKRPEAASETAIPAEVQSEKESELPFEQPRSKRSGNVLVAILATCVVLIAVPQTRQRLKVLCGRAAHAGKNWLNPPPDPLPQAVAQHDSFNEAGDEYKLPNPANISDATTDPSQIRVVPVIDPTAKPDKNASTNGAQLPGTSAATPAQDANPDSIAQSTEAIANGSPEAQLKESAPAPAATGESTAATPVLNGAPPPSAPVPDTRASQVQPMTPPAQHTTPSQAPPANSSVGIPSSLRSQLASSTPEASGTRPPEAAMASIEPVNLPETIVLPLITQPVEPEYPAAAKASGQRGFVVLQVLIGRDGIVQDTKFLQGSLIFARASIDAVKQWKFKPYFMNGRPVSVQTAITLNFKPPA